MADYFLLVKKSDQRKLFFFLTKKGSYEKNLKRIAGLAPENNSRYIQTKERQKKISDAQI